jgi:glycine oxidase
VAFDAIVVGAGIIGSSIAWRLAQAGLRVALLDAGQMGSEASWAAAGMLAPGGEIESESPWTAFSLQNLRTYPAFVAELEAETGQTIDFQRLGAIEVALSEAEWHTLTARADAQSKMGIPSRALSALDLRHEIPRAAFGAAGAFLYPDDALVNPRDLMSALRRACLTMGVEIREGTRVEEIRPNARHVEVLTAGERFDGGSGVLAAGAWSSQIRVAGFALPRAFPVRGHLSAIRLEAGSIGPILRHGSTYILQRADGFTIAGGSSEDCGFDREIDRAIVADIRCRAAALVPEFAQHPGAESWAGFRPAIVGDGPLIEEVSGTALWLAYGHYRNGILMAPLTASRVAGGITGTDDAAHAGFLPH